MKKPKYICFEGADGTYKTTTAAAIAEILREEGFSVLETKEPGTKHLELTMKLREIMLDDKYSLEMTKTARELISQAIRSVHLEKLIEPALLSGEYDYIIQDRGIVSGMVYGAGCKIAETDLHRLTTMVLNEVKEFSWYDQVILMYRASGPNVAVAINAKSEFESGDAMENQPEEFHQYIHDSFMSYAKEAPQEEVFAIDVESVDQSELLWNIMGRIGSLK